MIVPFSFSFFIVVCCFSWNTRITFEKKSSSTRETSKFRLSRSLQWFKRQTRSCSWNRVSRNLNSSPTDEEIRCKLGRVTPYTNASCFGKIRFYDLLSWFRRYFHQFNRSNIEFSDSIENCSFLIRTFELIEKISVSFIILFILILKIYCN